MADLNDPFQEARSKCPVHVADFDGETIPMILTHKEARKAAKDWQTYSSDAPRRVPIPSEENVRSMRQLPLELDPPQHTAFRKLVEPFFLRPTLPEVQEQITQLIRRLLSEAIERGCAEIVREFSIPLQSHALTYLLNVDESEAETWISWGTHVFKEGDGASKGSSMENYCQSMFEQAAEKPGEDFFSALNEAEIDGRKLTLEEKLGYANLAFAGGRDTIIHTATRIVAYFAEHPEALARLREHPEAINPAAEEFFRVFIPLTHIGRVCPHATDVHGHRVKAGERVSLVWSSANRDPNVFEDANTIKLDRKPNPHIAFGFGVHNCLGAHHARAIMRTLLREMSQMIGDLKIVEKTEQIEREGDYERKVGYELLRIHFTGR